MYKKYDIIYSLGENCACAMYLMHLGLRLTAGPFDWLACASFETRCELILNNFKDFINCADLKKSPKDNSIINDDRYDYYTNARNNFLHCHDFSVGVPLSISYSLVLSKYDRRIARFYNNIRRKRRVCMVWFSHYTDTPDDVIIKYCNEICRYFNKTIDFLIIEHLENQQQPIYSQIYIRIKKYLRKKHEIH